MLAEFLGLTSRNRTTSRISNASIENPTFDLNSPEAYDLLAGGSKSESGVSVSHENSLTIAAVWQAVSLVSGDVSKLPIYPYVRTKDDDREIDNKHPAYFAAAVRANEQKSARRFWRDLMVHALIWNNAYAWIDRSNGKMELLNLLPDRTGPTWRKVGERSEYGFVSDVGGHQEWFSPGEILHIRGISLEGMAGCDLVKFARDAWGLYLAAQNFESKFFKNGARMGGILEIPAGMNKQARDTVEEGYRKTYEGGDNPFKTVILREGAKFHAGQVTPEQGQVIDLREEQKREVASFFNIPPSKLGIRDSVSYNSFEQDNLSYLQGCLHHWLDTIADECNMKLLREVELRTDTHYFEHNVSKFIQADWKTLNEGLEIMRRNEIISADEWRRKLNMNKRPDGGGGEYINPNTKPAPSGGPAAFETKSKPANLMQHAMNFLAAIKPKQEQSAMRQPEIHVHVPTQVLEMKAPIVNIAAAAAPNVVLNVPEQPTPIVNVKVEAQDPTPIEVVVNVPEQPAPVVNNTIEVAAPIIPAAEVTVNIPPAKATETVIERGRDGEIVRSVTRPIE